MAIDWWWTYILVGGFKHFLFHILGMSSSQLTFTPSFFRGVGKRLFNWEGTIKKYQMKWLLEGYPPNCHKPWFSQIRCWHYRPGSTGIIDYPVNSITIPRTTRVLITKTQCGSHAAKTPLASFIFSAGEIWWMHMLPWINRVDPELAIYYHYYYPRIIP